LANATVSCTGGTCAVASCKTDFLDCDHVPTNGCEVDARSSQTNCGECGSACAQGLVCSSAACTPVEIVSSCTGTVSFADGMYTLGSGWCYYLLSPAPTGQTYTLAFQAKMLDSDGYGIWFAGNWNGGNVTAPAAQYDIYYGIGFLKYPDQETVISSWSYATDNSWHAWEIRSSEAEVVVVMDGTQIFRYTGTRPGDQVGFRTWRSHVQLTGFEYK